MKGGKGGPGWNRFKFSWMHLKFILKKCGNPNKYRQCFFQFKEFVIIQWVQTVLLTARAELNKLPK